MLCQVVLAVPVDILRPAIEAFVYSMPLQLLRAGLKFAGDTLLFKLFVLDSMVEAEVKIHHGDATDTPEHQVAHLHVTADCAMLLEAKSRKTRGLLTSFRTPQGKHFA